MRPSLRHALLAAALSSHTTLAQNSTSNLNFNSSETCSGIDNPAKCCPAFLGLDYISSSNTSVVSTGHVSFNPASTRDEWFLSVLVNDTGSTTDEGRNRYKRESFLSVSDSTPDASVCVYQFSPVNATKSSSGSGCAGVFSEECMAFIQEAVRNVTNENWRVQEECPDAIFGNSRVEARFNELCGVVLTPNEQRYSLERFLVPNHNCSFPDLPGIDLPDNYQTPARGNSNYLWKDSSFRSGYSNLIQASTYDQYLSQTIPFAIVTSQVEANQNNGVELVCVTPNNTRPGAPAIKDSTPWEEGGGETGGESTGVKRTMSGSIVVVLAAFMGLILA